MESKILHTDISIIRTRLFSRVRTVHSPTILLPQKLMLWKRHYPGPVTRNTEWLQPASPGLRGLARNGVPFYMPPHWRNFMVERAGNAKHFKWSSLIGQTPKPRNTPADLIALQSKVICKSDGPDWIHIWLKKGFRPFAPHCFAEKTRTRVPSLRSVTSVQDSKQQNICYLEFISYHFKAKT